MPAALTNVRSLFVLCRLPETIEFFEGAIFEPSSAGVDGFLDLLKPRYEFGDAAVQELLRLQFLESCQIDDGKQ